MHDISVAVLRSYRDNTALVMRNKHVKVTSIALESQRNHNDNNTAAVVAVATFEYSKAYFGLLQPRCVDLRHHCDKCKSTENAERYYHKVTAIRGEYLKILSQCRRCAYCCNFVTGVLLIVQQWSTWPFVIVNLKAMWGCSISSLTCKLWCHTWPIIFWWCINDSAQTQNDVIAMLLIVKNY